MLAGGAPCLGSRSPARVQGSWPVSAALCARQILSSWRPPQRWRSTEPWGYTGRNKGHAAMESSTRWGCSLRSSSGAWSAMLQAYVRTLERRDGQTALACVALRYGPTYTGGESPAARAQESPKSFRWEGRGKTGEREQLRTMAICSLVVILCTREGRYAALVAIGRRRGA